jgi:hypothetical protein
MDLLTPGFSVANLIGELKLFALLKNLSPEHHIRNQTLSNPNANYCLAIDAIKRPPAGVESQPLRST